MRFFVLTDLIPTETVKLIKENWFKKMSTEIHTDHESHTAEDVKNKHSQTRLKY